MKTQIKYSIHAELNIVVEKRDYEKSIFASQYAQALRSISGYVGQHDIDDALKPVAFSGERGDGKTSCMETVKHIIEYNSEEQEYLRKLNLGNLIGRKFHCLDTVDPSFFDRSHNILELVVSRMYLNVVKKKCDNPECQCTLLKKFEEVKRCIDNIHKNEKDQWDEMQELDDIASGMELRSKMSDLAWHYLRYFDSEFLVVSIDDIDLNMAEAYSMCEQIRKYFAIRNCIILISVRMSQLKDAVRQALMYGITNNCCCSRDNKADDSTPQREYDEMAEKYIEKLLPASCHIVLPHIYDQSDIELVIEGVEMQRAEIKDVIVRLIYLHTGYLFFNSRGGVSPIVPNNLRMLMHLVGMLVAMPDRFIREGEQFKCNSEIQKRNQATFKEYFYKEWTSQLAVVDRQNIKDLIEERNETAINKTALRCLETMIQTAKDKDYGGNAGKIKDAIVNQANFSYNITIGDVFYIINLLDQDMLSREKQLLLFFIRSYYSMKLYEAYDDVTAGLYRPEGNSTFRGSVYKDDERFANTTSLQRLVGGSFFTFNPGDLISESRTDGMFDKRFINNKPLYDLLAGLSRRKDNPDEAFKKQFRLAEFFILTTTCKVLNEVGETPEVFQTKHRLRPTVFTLQSIDNIAGNRLFDALSIFGNIVNPKYTYSRYNSAFNDIYQFAMENDFSLLRQMMEKVASTRSHIQGDDNSARVHKLLSDAVIRNADILSAMYENTKAAKRRSHEAVSAKSIASLYRNIMNSGISIYRGSGDGDIYEVEFHFLEPLCDLIGTIDDTDIKIKWEQIFNPADDTAIETEADFKKKIRGKSKPSTIREAIRNANIPELQGVNLDELIPSTENDKPYASAGQNRNEILHQVWQKIHDKRSNPDND